MEKFPLCQINCKPERWLLKIPRNENYNLIKYKMCNRTATLTCFKLFEICLQLINQLSIEWEASTGGCQLSEQWKIHPSRSGEAERTHGMHLCHTLQFHRLNNNPDVHYHISTFCCLRPSDVSSGGEHRKSNQLAGKWKGTAVCSLLQGLSKKRTAYITQVAVGGRRWRWSNISRPWRSLKIYYDLNSWPSRRWENLILPLHNLEQHQRRRRRFKAASVTFIIVI